ncbi:MAG: helix-turn-helix domain-containing protein [Acidobacteriota bacterium]
MKESFDGLIDHLLTKGFFMEEAVEILEKGMIERVLRQKSSNQSEAAKALGIHRNTLLRKMLQYDIDGKRPRPKPASTARNAKPAAAKQQSKTTRRPRTA